MLTFYRQKDFLITLTLVIIFVILTVGLIFWLQTEAVTLAETTTTLSTFKNGSDQAAQLSVLAKQTASSREIINTYFVTPETVANFIGEIESLATSDKINLTVNQAVASPMGLDFNLYAEGSFNNLFNFIQLLDRLPFNVKLSKISLAHDAGWSAVINLTLISFDK